ncbi:MAG: hypothetical protein J7M12_06885 [Candidatus Hydrogenedentes bacterium]|nr:hypothetical protein [Candidatus Hydrogenedentota bacterium]
MAMKGRGYQKTLWDYQERPVASSKLNGWDDQIEHALEVVHEMLALAWGGGDGVVRGATDLNLKVVPTSPPSLAVVVGAGRAFISRFVYKLAADSVTETVAVPTDNPRIDLVVARLADWTVAIIKGTESAVPEAPATGMDEIVLAELYLRPGMGSIEDNDDGTNGYITDRRAFV